MVVPPTTLLWTTSLVIWRVTMPLVSVCCVVIIMPSVEKHGRRRLSVNVSRGFLEEPRCDWSATRTWEEGVVEHGVGDVGSRADLCRHVENLPPHRGLVVELRQGAYRKTHRATEMEVWKF